MKAILIAVVSIVAIVAFTVLFGYVTSLLWNYALVPQGLKEIDTFTGTALNMLGALLCGGATFTNSKSTSK